VRVHVPLAGSYSSALVKICVTPAPAATNNFGFTSTRDYPVPRANERQLLVGIFGGSVAAWFCQVGTERLASQLPLEQAAIRWLVSVLPATTAAGGLASTTEPGARPGWPGAPAPASGKTTIGDHFGNLKGWIAGAYFSSEKGARSRSWDRSGVATLSSCRSGWIATDLRRMT